MDLGLSLNWIGTAALLHEQTMRDGKLGCISGWQSCLSWKGERGSAQEDIYSAKYTPVCALSGPCYVNVCISVEMILKY